jgi:hypothetical protein
VRIAAGKYFAAGTSGYVRLSNNTGASGSVVIADAVKWVYLPPPPTGPGIASQPQSQTVIQGNTANFTAIASGTAPLAYQWKHAGTNLPGATNNSLVRYNIKPADAGSYSVTVTNAFGLTNSLSATLTVHVPPIITLQPQSQSIRLGSNVTFTVLATGTPAVTYQWCFNGTNLAGATGASYSITNVLLAHEGIYSVLVSNLADSVASDDATLTVVLPPPPTIDSLVCQPNGQIQFQISGEAGTYAVEQSSNLVTWSQVLVTNIAGGPIHYATPVPDPLGSWFYRAVRLLQ